jgi:hypothetical protein
VRSAGKMERSCRRYTRARSVEKMEEACERKGAKTIYARDFEKACEGIATHLWSAEMTEGDWEEGERKRYVGLARTIYIRCICGMFGRNFTKYMVIDGAYLYGSGRRVIICKRCFW